jgi:hypothetical protein
MLKQIIIPKLPPYLKEAVPRAIELGTRFVFEKYGPKTFNDCVLMIRPNSRRGLYFNNQNHTHRLFGNTPVASISCRSKLYLYEKKSLGRYRQGINVGPLIECACCIVHELTHHAQFKRNGINQTGTTKGGELETTGNELEFLKKYFPDWYELIMIEEPTTNKKMERKKFASQVSPKRKRILEVYDKINQLKYAIAKAEKSKLYTLRWQGKVETLHSIQRTLKEYENELQSLSQ